MKLAILTVNLILCCVSANPTPQTIFGYPPSTPVGQWVAQGLQGSIQSVQNALNSFPRPTLQNGNLVALRPSQAPVAPNQFGQGGPENLVPAQNGPIPNGPYPNGPYPNGQFPNGQFPNGQFPNGQFPNGQFPNGPAPIQPHPYEPVHLVQGPPNAPWPYRQAGSEESSWQNWIPFPIFPSYGQGEPLVIIISRPPKHPASHHETPTNASANSANSSAIPSVNTTEVSNMQEFTATQNVSTTPGVVVSTQPPFIPTSVPNTEGSTSTQSTENATNVSDLGLTMFNPVPLAPLEISNATKPDSMPTVQ